MSLVRWLCAEEVHLHPRSRRFAPGGARGAPPARCAPARRGCARAATPARVARRSRRRAPTAPVRRSSPRWRCAGLRRFRPAGAATGGPSSRRVPVAEARARQQQLGLPVVQLAREFAPQFQVAVHHLVHDAQHQVGRLRGQVHPGRAWRGAGPRQQPLGVLIEDGAVAGVHAQQHAVKHRKTHRAGVDAAQHRRPAALGHRLGGRFAALAGKAAKHEQVVLRGVVVVRGQLGVQQVAHVQIQQAGAAQRLQRGLYLAQPLLELGPGCRPPHT